MGRNLGNKKRYCGNYNADLLWSCLIAKGFASAYALAKHLGKNADTAYRVFAGHGTYKQVRPYADYLKADWAELHDVRPRVNGHHRAERSRSVR